MNENSYLYNNAKASLSKIDNIFKLIFKGVLMLTVPDSKIAQILADRLWKYKVILLLPFFIILLFFVNVFSISATDNTLSPLMLPENLEGVYNYSFDLSGVPNNTPFGNFKNIKVTAGFLDKKYFEIYNRHHKGLDIIPSNEYYSNNDVYKLTNEPVFFATCSGIARSMSDSFGANYISILCDDKKHEVLFVHNKLNFIEYGKKTHVIAGQPIGIMGCTGNAFGEHIHYSIIDLDKGDYVDPMDFINTIIE